MSATSDDLMTIARAAADKIELSGKIRVFPSFGDIEQQCEQEFDELLGVLHEDEIFEPVSLDRQEELFDAIRSALPQDKRELIDELVDSHSRQVWLNQEAAFHLGMAIGMRIANGRSH